MLKKKGLSLIKHVLLLPCIATWLSRWPQGEMHVHERNPRHYFTPEMCRGEYPCMCRPRNGGKKWHKCRPGRSSRKTRKSEPRQSTWGQIRWWNSCGLTHMREGTRCGARRCSGRGRTNGGKHSGTDAHATGLCFLNEKLTWAIFHVCATCFGGHRVNCLF